MLKGTPGLDVPAYLTEHGVVLNAQQRQAMLTDEGQYLLLAVPGAGKTTVLVGRLAHLLCNRGVAPNQILTITFNRESARDMQRRFSQLFGTVCPAPQFSTIHSFCFGVLRQYAALRKTKMPQLIEGGASPVRRDSLLRQACTQAGCGIPADEELEELGAAVSFAKNTMTPREQLGEIDCPVGDFPGVFAQYEAIKRENAWMDFDDMLLYTRSVFHKLPGLLEHYRQRYRFLNVDEAQDTSRVQHAILRQLAGKDGNLFMVGDEDQSIYGFRGASPQELLEFKHQYPGGKILKMEENFRSTPQIVQAASQLICHNKNRFSKQMATRRKAGPKVACTVLSDANQQYDYLVRQLKKLPQNQTAAILYRTNDCAVGVMDALERAGIPFYVRDHTNHFLSGYVVQDIRAFLRLGENPADMAAFQRICFKTDARVSREMLEFVRAAATPGETLFEVLLANENLDRASAELISVICEETERFFEKKPLAVLREIEYVFGYRNFLRWKTGGGTYFEQLSHKLTVLKSIAAACGSTREFCDRLQELGGTIAHASQRSESRVVLSTVHSAKGLEFDRVYLIDLMEGFFPSASSIEQQLKGSSEALEEERRLFYVAVTRAKNHLELLTADLVNGETYSASRFVRELLPDQLDKPGRPKRNGKQRRSR